MKEQAQALTHAVSVFKLDESAPAAHPTLSSAPLPEVERRVVRAQGATNVSRLPALKASKTEAAARAARPARSKVSGSDTSQQEWEEF